MDEPLRVDGLDSVRVSDGEIVTTPDGTTHYLNGMASLIYELCDGRPLSSIAASVETIFDLPSDDAASLVDQAVGEMREKGLVAEIPRS